MEYHPHAGFYYSKLLTYLCHDYLAIFQASIWVGVCIGKFLNDLRIRYILDTKLHGLGAC